RTEKDGIHNTEDESVDADSECKRNDGNRGESGIVEQGAKGIGGVAEKVFCQHPSVGLMEALLCAGNVAELTVRRGFGFFAADSFITQTLDLQLEVGRNFCCEVSFSAFALPEHFSSQLSARRLRRGQSRNSAAAIDWFHEQVACVRWRSGDRSGPCDCSHWYPIR